MSDVNKLTPHNDGARRRMYMKALTAVAITPRGANPEANVTFFKQNGPRDGETFAQFLARMREEDSGMTEARARRMFDSAQKQRRRPGESEAEYNRRKNREQARKAGDVVDIVTSTDEGHQHGVSVRANGDEVVLFTSYAGSGRDTLHDHQMVRNDDGSYSFLENFGHTHDDIPAETIRDMLVERMLEKQDRRPGSMPDGSFPIANRSDLMNAIRAFGRARRDDRQAVANHIRSRARTLGLTELIPQEGVLADLLKTEVVGDELVVEENNAMTEQEKQEMDALKAQIATLTSVASLSDAHKAHYDALDEESQAAFLKMDDAGKEAAVKAKADSNPVVYKSEATGEEYRLTDDPRLTAMAKQMDVDRKAAEDARKAAADMALTKRAETDLAHFPGSVDVRKSLLEAVDTIADAATRDGVHAALKAKSAANAGAFTVVGTDAGVDVNKTATDGDDAQEQLSEMARDLMKSDASLTFEQAYVKVMQDPANLNVTKHLAIS